MFHVLFRKYEIYLEASWSFNSNFAQATVSVANFKYTRINPFVNLNNIITEVSLCLNKTNSFHIPFPCGWDKRLVLLTENFPFQPSFEFQVDVHEPKACPRKNF